MNLRELVGGAETLKEAFKKIKAKKKEFRIEPVPVNTKISILDSRKDFAIIGIYGTLVIHTPKVRIIDTENEYIYPYGTNVLYSVSD